MTNEITINYDVTLEQDNQIKETIYNYFKENLYRATFYDYDGRKCDEDKLLTYWDNDEKELLKELYFSYYRPKNQYVKHCLEELEEDILDLYAECLWEILNKDTFLQKYADDDEEETYSKFLGIFSYDDGTCFNVFELFDDYIWDNCICENGLVPTVKEKNRLVLTLADLEPECSDECDEDDVEN